jgi:hypothetical protein
MMCGSFFAPTHIQVQPFYHHEKGVLSSYLDLLSFYKKLFLKMGRPSKRGSFCFSF